MPELVAELPKSPYVDDLISEKRTVREARELKGAISIFADTKFKLHKWHSREYVCQTAAWLPEGKERKSSWTPLGQTRGSDLDSYALRQ